MVRSPLRALPAGAARGKIRLQPARALVAILGCLRHEAEDELRQREGDRRLDLVRRHRHRRDVRVHHLERIVPREREAASEHVIEAHAERIEVGPVVEGAVGSPRLLGGHVRERAGELGPGHRLLFAREARREAEVGDLHCPQRRVDDEVVRLQVLVDDVRLVNVGQDPRQRDGDVEELPNRHSTRGDVTGERGPAEVFEDERVPVPEPLEAQHLEDPLRSDRPDDVALVAEARDVVRSRVVAPEELDDDGVPVGRAERAVEIVPQPAVERDEIAVPLQVYDCVHR